jgi:hypothetical protein
VCYKKKNSNDYCAGKVVSAVVVVTVAVAAAVVAVVVVAVVLVAVVVVVVVVGCSVAVVVVVSGWVCPVFLYVSDSQTRWGAPKWTSVRKTLKVLRIKIMGMLQN